jgi:serine beta-lactamase-like protein LACTB, mitochondrial
VPKKSRWPWVLLALFAAVLLFIPGLWVFKSLTAVPVHQDATAIPSQSMAPPQPSHERAIEESRTFLRSSLKEHNIAGLSIAVAHHDQIVWAEAFGLADVDKRTPITPQHRLRIGTASIPLTATALGLLLEEGKIKPDDDISIHVPQFPKKGHAITIRHLMGHLSGLRNDGGDESELYGAECKSPVEALEYFAGKDLLHAPNTKFHFSNYGYILLGAAIESASQLPFRTFLQQRILDPLNMRDTTLELTPTEARAPSYFPTFAADPTYGLDPMRDLNFSCYQGASAVLSTPTDLARFLIAIQNNHFHTKRSGYSEAWKFNGITLRDRPVDTFSHDGTILGGPAATLLSIPATKLHVVILTNTSYAPTSNLATTVAQAFTR